MVFSKHRVLRVSLFYLFYVKILLHKRCKYKQKMFFLSYLCRLKIFKIYYHVHKQITF